MNATTGRSFKLFILCAVLAITFVDAFTLISTRACHHRDITMSSETAVAAFRKRLLSSIISAAALPLSLSAIAHPSMAAEQASTGDQRVYWGVGCFWHTQHEFVQAEKNLLGRTDKELTVRKCSAYL